MGSEWDIYDDILPKPATNARAGSRFQPKAKPRPRNKLSVSVPSTLANDSKEKPVIVTHTESKTSHSVQHVDVADDRLTDPFDSSTLSSNLLENKEPLKKIEDSSPQHPPSGDPRTPECENLTSQLVGTGDGVGVSNARPLDVAISDSNVNWGSSSVKSAGKADSLGNDVDPFDDILLERATSNVRASMGFVLDPFSDILPEPATSKVEAGRKFQPKVKPGSRKETSASGASALHNVTEENLSKEPLENYKEPSSGVPFSEDTRSLALASPSPKVVTTDDLHLEVEDSVGPRDWHSISRKLTGENADIFSGLEYLDDFLSQSTTSTLSVASESQHKVAESALPGDTFLTLRHFDTNEGAPLGSSETSILHASNTEGGLDVPVLSSVQSSTFRGCDATQVHSFPEFLVTQDSVICTEAAVSNNDGDNNGRMETEFQKVEAFGIEYTHQGSIPSFPSDDVPDFPANKGPTGPVESLPSDVAISGDVLHSEVASGMPGKVVDNNMKRKTHMASEDLSQKPPTSLAAGEGIEAGEPSRRLRKRIPDPNINEPDYGNYDGGFHAESPSNVDDDNNDDEYRVDNAPLKKRVQRKSKKADPESEKPVQKRKKANEVTDKPAKKAPKKFPHSTRRNKRRVDKVLLETPDYEIDFQKVPIKQLILLAEIRERSSNKESSNSRIPSTNQSADNYSPREASYNEGEAFASEDDRDFNDDQTGSPVQLNTGYFNYHSFMDRTPSTRWSKQDTELFYEAVQQFGTDFSMIQQLFPDRTRNQIKLKFKKEERQHPLRLSEAVQNRSKNHSHFELVIEKLQAAQTQAEQDEIRVPAEEDEVEDSAHETNEETAKSEIKEQDENKDEMEADGSEVHSPKDIDESD